MDDYISRQAAIEDIEKAISEHCEIDTHGDLWSYDDDFQGLNLAREIIKRKTISADARENVRGEWIEKYYESNETGETVFHGMIMCSVCGHVPKVGWLSNYCPNCGAQMMRGES